MSAFIDFLFKKGQDSVEEFNEQTGEWKTVNITLSQKMTISGYQAVPASAVCPAN